MLAKRQAERFPYLLVRERARDEVSLERQVREVRDADDVHPGRTRGCRAGRRVLERDGLARRAAEELGRAQVDVGRRLRLRHVLGGDDDLERLRQAGRLQHRLDPSAGRVRGDAEAAPAGERRDELPRAGPGLDAVPELAEDELVELVPERLGLAGPAEQALEDPAARLPRRPEELRLLGAAERPLVAGEERGLGARPQALRVEQQAVAVEDDRAGRGRAAAQCFLVPRWKYAE
jgi:hypothetical protein